MATLTVDVMQDHHIQQHIYHYDEASAPSVYVLLRKMLRQGIITHWDYAQGVLAICRHIVRCRTERGG